MPRESPAAPPVAEWQGGAFTRGQALDAGFSADQIDRRRRSGAWRRLCGSTLVAGDGPPSALAWAWSAHLACPGSVISHLTAGRLYGFPLPDDDVAHVIAGPRRRPLPRLQVHRVPLEENEVQTVEDLRGRPFPPLTIRARTAVDCLALLPLDEALSLWAWLSTRGVLTRDHLADATRRRFGRWGTGQLVTILHRTQGGALSRGERRLHLVLRRHRLLGWRANAAIVVDGRTIAVADVLFAAARVVVEFDGWQAHGNQDAFVRDRRRQNELVGLGYLVLRYTWDDLVTRPDAVAAEIAAAVAARS